MLSDPKQPVPIFPLPDVLLFPAVAVPLRVFELRYRTMVRDALSGERLIVLALLQPGWEADYHGSPEFHPLGCLARFDEVTWLPNDHYELRVQGVSRVRIGSVTREFPYRACRVSVLPQDPLSEDDPLIQLERRALIDAYTRFTRVMWPEALGQRPTLDTSLGFEALLNSLCMMVGADRERLLEWLEIDSLVDRSCRLRESIEAIVRGPRRRAPGDHEAN